jgi:hypothetical protein
LAGFPATSASAADTSKCRALAAMVAELAIRKNFVFIVVNLP